MQGSLKPPTDCSSISDFYSRVQIKYSIKTIIGWYIADVIHRQSALICSSYSEKMCRIRLAFVEPTYIFFIRHRIWINRILATLNAITVFSPSDKVLKALWDKTHNFKNIFCLLGPVLTAPKKREWHIFSIISDRKDIQFAKTSNEAASLWGYHCSPPN